MKQEEKKRKYRRGDETEEKKRNRGEGKETRGEGGERT